MANIAILSGNIGRDPELRNLDNGSAVATFSIATNESYKDKQGEWQNKTEWHNIVAWGKLAENCSKVLKKGDRAELVGKITGRTYTNKEGQERRITEIVINKFDKLHRPNNDGIAPAGVGDLPF